MYTLFYCYPTEMNLLANKVSKASSPAERSEGSRANEILNRKIKDIKIIDENKEI